MKILLCLFVILISFIFALNIYFFRKNKNKLLAWIIAIIVALICGYACERIANYLLS